MEKKSCFCFYSFLHVFRKGFSTENLPYRREGMADESKLNYCTYLDTSAIKQNSFQYYYFDIQGVEYCQTSYPFIHSPGGNLIGT